MANTTVTTQRISQLPTANTVVPTDTFPFLQANTGVTKTATVNVLAQAVAPIILGVSNTVSFPSQNTANVPFLSLGNTSFVSMNVTASENNNITNAKILAVVDNSTINTSISQVALGPNQITFGTVLNGANLDFIFSRGANTTANVNIKYTYKATLKI